MSKSAFITGGTGFIGKAVIAKLCSEQVFHKIYVLIRASSKQAANERLEQLIRSVLPPHLVEESHARMRAVPGDLLADSLFTFEDDQREILEQVTHILHIGASTDFGIPLEMAREYNVKGTERIITLANQLKKNGLLERLDYVSTAFVAGKTRGVVSESDLMRGQSFSNSYEQSKYEAELLVREEMPCLPICIHRPSIVVGDSSTGFTPHFKVLYWPLRCLSKEVLQICIINLRYKIDVVPCDFVAKSIVALMNDPTAIGETFHLTCGRGNEVSMKTVLFDAYRYTNLPKKKFYPYWSRFVIEKTPLRKLLPSEFWDLQEIVKPYEAYFRGIKVKFSNDKTLRHLEKFSIKPPSWNDYAKTVLAFCTESGWGRRLKKPEYNYYKSLWSQSP